MTLTQVEVRDRRSPVLRDGVRLSDLIDLDRRAVSLRVFADPEIHRLELERLFAKSWVGIAHESEIPEVGDYVVRQIGLDSVIVVRNREGDISVLLNACSHRGMEVCWAEKGRASAFTCPFHGWNFNLSGGLVGAPQERRVYGEEWDKAQHGLTHARVATRHGMIFGSFDSLAPSFEDYLGDLGWYWDYGLDGQDWEVVGSDARIVVHHNWKIVADSYSGDSYHGTTLHKSLNELGIRENASAALDHVQVTMPEAGHSVFAVNSGAYKKLQEFNARADGASAFNESADSGYSFESFGLLMSLMFPSTIIHTNHVVFLPDGSAVKVGGMGEFVPLAENKFVLNFRVLAPKGLTNEQKRFVYNERMTQMWLIATDDCAQGPSIQKVAGGAVGMRQPFNFFNVQGATKLANWPGPGVTYAGPSRDDSQWDFWTHWYRALTEEA